MTRKRFKKLMMAHGWPAKKAEKESRWAIQWWQAKIVKHPDDD